MRLVAVPRTRTRVPCDHGSVTASTEHVGVAAGRSEGAVTVIIPAHDEETALPRLLAALGSHNELDIVVVCNGCSDNTAQAARSVGTHIRVFEMAEASKWAAIQHGDSMGRHFPRIYVDADVVISGEDCRVLAHALDEGVLACGPARHVELTASSPWVRWYYDVWQLLPQVRSGLFGRGVIALSQEGFRRLQGRPRFMSDDLAFSEAFDASERLVVDQAVVRIRAPQTLAALVARRVRVVTGNAQFDQQVGRAQGSVTGIRTLATLALRRPALVPKVFAFAVVTFVARRRAKRFVNAGDFSTWHRDESSRA